VQYGVVNKSGNTHTFGETKLGVGRENTKAYLKENPKVAAEIEKAVRTKSKEVDYIPMPTGKSSGE
jgi:recombination protein RecA